MQWTEERKAQAKAMWAAKRAAKASNPGVEAPKVEQADKYDALEQKFDKLLDIVGGLSDKITQLDEKKIIVATTTQTVVDTIAPKASDLSMMIPPAWRAMIDKELGTEYQAEVLDSAGNFLIKIYMPEGVDRRQGERMGRDHSSGLIRRTSDLADLEVWCKRIANTVKSRLIN